ncbi:MAG: uroporphyrinogen-III synthase [Burkholderiaceae bacterium]|nr:uroporphyrinogen-III synthase [Burkholderiaceae bacterium]
MSGPVVITRPLAQAQPLAERVAALGLAVEVLPLLEITALPDPAPLQAVLARLADFDLVAFVSPNAIDAAFQFLPAWPAGVAIAVVGEGSKLALAAHGVSDASARIYMPADSAHSDTEHLLAAMDLQALHGARVLIVRGDSGRELMGDAFRAAGADVTVVAAYRRGVPSLCAELAQRLPALLAGSATWLITSSEALRGLLALVRQLPEADTLVAKLQHQEMIVPHARIAETATSLGFHCITQTGSGDERLLAALQSRP